MIFFFFQFCFSVHHIMIRKNTSLMQLTSVYFTYSKSLFFCVLVFKEVFCLLGINKFQFCVSVHHKMISKNTSLMQLISIYFTYSKTYYKWNIYLLAASSWCSNLSFMIISCWILLVVRNVSDKSCRKDQNTHFVFSNFFSKIDPFMR